MKTFKVDIHAMRDLYSFLYLAQECKGHVDAYPDKNHNKHANGKSQIGIMSISSQVPTVIELSNDDDIKIFEKFEMLKENNNGRNTRKQ